MGKTARNTKLVGKTMLHDDLGRVTVDSVVVGSLTKVNITCIQRRKGWNHLLGHYDFFRELTVWHPNGQRTLYWGFTNRDEYGQKDVAHIKTLTEIN